jgi:hypothetical protein
MTEKDRIAGLAEQIDLAKRHVSEWPEWLRSSAHFAGTDHASSEEHFFSDDEQAINPGDGVVKFE